ncbi:MAG: hypothetical protein IJK97_07110 [Thermoguttaceae bacterium]|nr:hypothetical protein [Thermoguttaceae bacterium]MBR0191897.1 hypothetical protein [Thermoguttaceae bacterium]
MSYFHVLSDLSDEPFTLPFHDDGRPLQKSYDLTPEQWRERYALMRAEYTRWEWLYSPICSRLEGMRRLLLRLCLQCLEAENHPKKSDHFRHVRDLDLVLGLITEEEYKAEEARERANLLKAAIRDTHVNRTLDEICEEMQRVSRQEE